MIAQSDTAAETHSTANKELLLRIRNLSVNYTTRRGMLGAVDNVNLDLYRGEVLGLVGESGCGKSTLGKAIMRMIPPPGRIDTGELHFNGADLMAVPERTMREIRGSRISMIFQDPMTSLNPVQRIDRHIIEAIRVHKTAMSVAEANEMAERLIERLGIGKRRLRDYPHQLSGGMRQRVMIGLALALKADLIIADEPTTSLDVIVEAQFLDLLRELKDDFNLTILLITHNIGVVAELCDRVGVMYAGRLAEVADVESLFLDPQHPYTQGLLNSVPNIKLDGGELYRMAGQPPNLINPPSGCRFHPRCPHAMARCSQAEPSWMELKPGHSTACWLYEEQIDK
ncbi:MAG: ABC transporter ATP-binding protein [Anaerolineae bacterium]|nr:ABC transporter ATP-binding protein [Anaerolineae bacterium]